MVNLTKLFGAISICVPPCLEIGVCIAIQRVFTGWMACSKGTNREYSSS